MADQIAFIRGSEWRRWDPHIHAPGTVLNDLFPSFEGEPTKEAWDQYLDRLEAATPTIEALGITDYYSTECYVTVCDYRDLGRLQNVGLIFPNVELRYGVGTSKGTPVNFHILVSPEDPKHLEKLERFLAKLTFKSQDDTYRCTPDDIRRLGRDFSGKQLNDRAAFSEGANQFKVEVDAFIEAWQDTPWIKENALIAIPGSNQDGSAGLQKDASLAALRQKIERIAHIIFASQPNQREFWAGRSGKLTEARFLKDYGCYKPCLHGSDAHELKRVGEPDLQRFTWIKGDPSFESLRQACLEPIQRAIVATEMPTGALSSQAISSIRVENAEWFGDQPVPLNAGLVGIIGARGSGKTALADMIAGGAYALSEHVSEKSFVRRAADLLDEAEPHLLWLDGSETSNPLSSVDHEDLWDTPKAQYLSQQFVEQLLNLRAARGREARKRHEATIAQIGEQIGRLRDQQDALAGLEKQREKLSQQRTKDNEERMKLVPKAAEKHAQDFERITAAVEKVRQAIEEQDRRLAQLDLLGDYVGAFLKQQVPRELAVLKTEHERAGLSDAQWENFRLKFSGDAVGTIETERKKAHANKKQLTGEPVPVPSPNDPPSEVSLLPADEPVEKLSLSVLAAEEARLQRLIGVDNNKRKQHSQLTEKIRRADATLKSLETQIKNAKGGERRYCGKVQGKKSSL